MDADSPKFSESDSVAELNLTIARSRTVATVIEKASSGIGAHPEIAQCRIWLVRPGDQCTTCAMRDSCPDQGECLHLMANAGGLAAAGGQREVGAFRRFPIAVGLLGRAVRSANGGRISDIRRDPSWVRAAEWARNAGIRGFIVEPMRYDGVCLGVIGAFTRPVASESRFSWLRGVAAHTAAALELLAVRVQADTPRIRADPDAVLPESEIRRFERENLLNALHQTRWKIYGSDGAAALLGLRPTTLASRIKKMKLADPR